MHFEQNPLQMNLVERTGTVAWPDEHHRVPVPLEDAPQHFHAEDRARLLVPRSCDLHDAEGLYPAMSHYVIQLKERENKW